MDMLRSFWTQYYPPPPSFTTDQLPDLSGKVLIVTGGNSGLGLALIKLLYPTGAKIYMASRSEERANKAIQEVVSTNPAPETPGRLEYLHLDLNDLPSVPKSAADFASRESRLDVLWNNAGLGASPTGTTTKQNLEGHIGVNCVAPLLFTLSLLPQLRNAAATSPPGSVRVIWTASLVVESFSPRGGVDLDLLSRLKETEDSTREYSMSKCGNWFLAIELARRHGADGVLSVAQNPGQINSDAWKHQNQLLMKLVSMTMHEPLMGAHTMLYAGLSPELTAEHGGAYIMPWGRIMAQMPRKDIREAIESGAATRFWNWCEEQWKPYL